MGEETKKLLIALFGFLSCAVMAYLGLFRTDPFIGWLRQRYAGPGPLGRLLDGYYQSRFYRIQVKFIGVLALLMGVMFGVGLVVIVRKQFFPN